MKSLIYFLLSLFFTHHLNAQMLPNIEVPTAIKPSFYEMLKTDYLVKTTKYYHLKGNVKCINETAIAKQNNQPAESFAPTPGFVKKIKYEFLENNRLILYMEDTLKALKHSNAKIEKYFFNEAGEKLFSIESYNGTYQSSKTIKKIDQEGFIFQEIYKCYEPASGNYYDTSSYYTEIFDYILDYNWNKNRDTVQLKYIYKTPESPYERLNDRLYSFASEKRREKQIPTIKSDSLNSLITDHIFSVDSITYDKKGNIIKWFIGDYEIKNSYPNHIRYEYKYNENNELIESSCFSTGLYGNYELDYKYKIDYLEYDKNGNWTLKKVISNDNSEYIYQREISYY